MKKLAKDETSGSMLGESRRAWKQDLARLNASFFSSSLPDVNAQANTNVVPVTC